MKLDHEEPGRRRYLSDGGEYIEVRAQLQMLRGETSAKGFDIYPEIAEKMGEMLVERLDRMIRQRGEEPFGDVTLRLEELERIVYLVDDDGNELLDDEGNFIVDPEFPDPIKTVVLSAETGYWPAAPKEPTDA